MGALKEKNLAYKKIQVERFIMLCIPGTIQTSHVTPQELRLIHLRAQAAGCSGTVHSGPLPVPGSRGSRCTRSDRFEA